jgi:hypothetical protein
MLLVRSGSGVVEIPRPVRVLGFINGEPVRDWLWLLPQWGADIGLCDTRGEGGNAGESQAGGDCAVKPSFFVLTDKRAVRDVSAGCDEQEVDTNGSSWCFPGRSCRRL